MRAIKKIDYSEHITLGMVAYFVGKTTKTLLRRSWLDEYGTRTDHNWRNFTIEDSCKIFYRINGRKPTSREVALFLYSLNTEEEPASALVLRLCSQGLAIPVVG